MKGYALPIGFIIPTDSITKTVEKGSSFVDSKVTYSATDSMILDMTNQKAYLYNNAVVIYEDMKLQAGYIELDFNKKTVYATGLKDSTGKISQKPVSEQKDDKFKAGEITYNFESKKGKIKDIITQQGDGFIHGSDIKKDTGDVFYVSHGKYTTCDLEEPHFCIEAKKIKVIPNDKIITGPAQLYIADVPTPLAIPFGYFPNKKGRASGILLPTYGESQNWGFFLRDGGFYFGTNEYFDLALRGDIYANGSFGGKASSNYKRRYHYNGGLNIGYSHIIDGNREFATSTKRNDFFVRWNHSQDSKANPSSRFSANVNAGSSSYNKFNGNATGDYLSNTFQSNIAYSKSFTGTPFNFSANARHSQNTINKKVDLSLPELAFTMNRIYPFKNNNRAGNKWYDKIGISANLNARNQVSAGDSVLFKEETLKRMQNGAQLSVPINTSLNILKYFTLSPGINTTSRIYYQTIQKSYDTATNQIVTDTVNGFKIANDYNLSAGLSTRLYGDYFFKTKRLKQIRHVAIPTVGFNYRPDFSESQYGYYKKVQSDATGNTQTYSAFQNGIYGSPGAGYSGAVSMSLNNTFEAKLKQQSDSGAVTKKVSLIDNFNIGTSYNMAAKSFKWSMINLAARTKLFKLLDVNTSAVVDPYQLNNKLDRIDYLQWEKGQIGRLTAANAALGTSLRSKDKKEKKKPTDPAQQDEVDYVSTHPNAYVDFDIPWSLNVYYNLSYNKNKVAGNATMKETVTQTANFSGDLRLTQKWKISLSSGYDFTNKKLSLTSIDIYRDLHCWEMSFNWIPFGFRQSFSLNINVKSSVLKDLKLTRRRSWQDYQ